MPSDVPEAPVDAQSAAAQRALLELVARRLAEGASVRDLLELAPLAPEQRAIAEMLLSQHETESAEDRDDGGAATRVQELEAELIDLRQANDALASALGACPICWGGDRACSICRGRGRSGFTTPDPELFRELVVPAVARVWSVKRADRRARAMRGGALHPNASEVQR